ncbi:MAG: riboflavin synthase [Planctomycetes bacterium]|nr:riboflavin synthase [Planctomycetota bacterium]
MFTGIVSHVGQVRSVSPSQAGKKLAVDIGPLSQALNVGDSVAVNGACLTAASIGGVVEFDVMGETLARTTLGGLSAGSKVNLERAMGVASAFDGHIVQGHIDGIAALKSIELGRQCHKMLFDCPADLLDLMVPKGSVAIDGVSLTLVDVGRSQFSVSLIPTTLASTTLGTLKSGMPVNIETDIIGKYVLKFMGKMRGGEGITEEKLRSLGFM